MDEPSEAEGEQIEERAKQSREEAEQSIEENEEGDEHSETEAEAEHSKVATEQSNLGQLKSSPPQDPVGEDELAAVLANMGEYGQPSSPADLPDEPPEKNTSKKSHAVEAGEEKLPVHDEEIGETDREQFVPKAPEEIPDGVGADLRASREPSTEAMEIKKLRRKQQRLLNTISQLRQQIQILKVNQMIERTTGKRKRATAAKSRRAKRRRTNNRHAGNHVVVPNDVEE